MPRGIRNGTTPAKRTMSTAGKRGMPISHTPKPTVALANDAVSTEEKMPPGYDQFSLSDEFGLDRQARQELGIKDTEEIGWIRDDRYWGSKVPGNRFLGWRRDNPGGRMIMQDGEPFSNGFDLVLVARPKSEVEKLRKREAAELKEYLKQHDPLNPDHIEAPEEDFDAKNLQRLKAAKRANTKLAFDNGMIGTHSPTSGLSYEEALDRMRVTPQMIEQEEAKWARGARHLDVSDEEYQSQRRESPTSPRDGGGKFISIPATVKPRNLAKAG